MQNNQEKIDFTNGVFLQIGGELGKDNSLPILQLIKIAEKLQNLVNALAVNESIELGTVSLSNFELALCGFKAGSAVPQFKYSPIVQLDVSFDIEGQRRLLDKQFGNLMQVANRGTYLDLIDLYPNSALRNSIVEPLFQFASSSGDSPMAFVDFEAKGSMKPIFKVQTFKKAIKEELITKEEEAPKQEKKRKAAFAKVLIPETDNDFKRSEIKIDEIYTTDSHSLDYAPQAIQSQGKIYQLRFPLRCKFEFVDGFYMIQSDYLDIIGTGENIEEAETNFAEEFGFVYARLNMLASDQMTKRIALIKENINYLVLKIE